jgi:hypothetical protein
LKPVLIALLFLLCAVGCQAQAQTDDGATVPTSVSVQMIIDSVQAKYPGNEWVKKCGPANHDGTCFDPNIPHLTFHVYSSRRRCENDEGVDCTELDSRWIPIGKPVAQLVTDHPEEEAKP